MKTLQEERCQRLPVDNVSMIEPVGDACLRTKPGLLPIDRLRRRRIGHCKPISPTIVRAQHAHDFIEVEGPGAATTKYRNLIPALIDGTVTVEWFRNRQCTALSLERRDRKSTRLNSS